MASDLQNSVVTPAEAQGISQLRQSHFPVGTESFGMPLDDACLARYLRARSGDVAKAAAMLSATLEWRREFGLPQVLKDEVNVIAKENSTGKVYVSGFDRQGRPVLVMRPREENTQDHDGNIKHIVYQMERARAILQRLSGGYGKVCIMIDYVGFSVRNASPMKTNMKTLRILQNHYPETLGVAYFVSPPFVFRSFWKVIYPFIDGDTKDKFCFVPGNAKGDAAQKEFSKNFDLDQLEEAFGGTYTTKFDSSLYIRAPMDQDFRSALAAASAGQTAPAAAPAALPPTVATSS
ncbi:unnamed protein product [Laminaria digitata]